MQQCLSVFFESFAMGPPDQLVCDRYFGVVLVCLIGRNSILVFNATVSMNWIRWSLIIFLIPCRLHLRMQWSQHCVWLVTPLTARRFDQSNWTQSRRTSLHCSRPRYQVHPKHTRIIHYHVRFDCIPHLIDVFLTSSFVCLHVGAGRCGCGWLVGACIHCCEDMQWDSPTPWLTISKGANKGIQQ